MQRILPNWMKSKAPPNGMQINIVTLVKTILLPLVWVGFDIGSDGVVLREMWFVLTILDASYETRPDFAVVLVVMSCICLLLSLLNLVLSNPCASLLINARTTVHMKTRELERKDVPVPLGAFNIVMLLFCSLRPSV